MSDNMTTKFEKVLGIANSLSNEEICNLIEVLSDRMSVYIGKHNSVMLSSEIESVCLNGCNVQINLDSSCYEDLKEWNDFESATLNS
jgi:hypothetical protein